LGNYTQAIQYFDKALAIDPNDKDALNGKANAVSHLKGQR
jgi:Flp pilus assembly protein TadD